MGLVIAPTRELAIQVNRELTWLYADAGAVVVNCVGGMDARREQRALNFGAHIVVGTPGRLRDHIERGHLDLSELKVAVLDEADEMLDMGFREDLEFILDAAAEERRTLLFSATLAREIVQLAKSYQNDALRIDTLGRNEPHRDIEYRAVRVAPNEIEHAIVNLLRYFESPGALVFCNTRESVRALHCEAARARLRRGRPVGRAAASASAPTPCRPCATATPASASPPTSPPAASTCPTWAWSSTPTCRSTRRPSCTARAAPAGPARRASPPWSSPTPAAARPSSC